MKPRNHDIESFYIHVSQEADNCILQASLQCLYPTLLILCNQLYLLAQSTSVEVD